METKSKNKNYDLMRLSLAAAVPLHIMQIQAKAGGKPSAADMERIKLFEDKLAGPGGEDILFASRSKKPGRTAELFNDLAHAIAVLAFMPGGIEIFGEHFEANPLPVSDQSIT